MKLSTLVSYGSLSALAVFVAYPPTVQAVRDATGGKVNLDPLGLFGSLDAPGSLAIANAEGTRTPDGGRTSAYRGHTDPGNGAKNLGQFSWQAGGCHSPQGCDQKGLQRIQAFVPKLLEQAKQQQVPIDRRVVVNGADLAIQAPLAANDFIPRLKQCQQQGKTGSEAVLCARTRSYIDPKTGRLDAPGLGNMQRVQADQQRRMQAISKVVQK